LIIGECLGDTDRIIVRCDPESDDFGSVLISLALDSRKDWYTAASSLVEFLEKASISIEYKYWSKRKK
jgi:hypothetical protein